MQNYSISGQNSVKFTETLFMSSYFFASLSLIWTHNQYWAILAICLNDHRPSPANSITMQSRLVHHDRNLCCGGTVFLPGSAKLPLLLNQHCDFKILQDSNFLKPVLYSLFYCSFLVWAWRRHKHSFKMFYLFNDLMTNDSVFRAAPGFPWVCY